MNKLIIFILASIITGCYSNEKVVEINSQNTELIKNSEVVNAEGAIDETFILLDTLTFNNNMNGELLNEKIKLGSKKFEFYKRFIVPEKIDTLQIIEEEHSRTQIKYLGLLKDLSNENSYHVISNFKIIGIGEMLSPRGRSEVAFIDNVNENTIIYNLGMPNNLPNSIKDNVLQFELNDVKTGISISGGLPPLLCLPEIGCN